MGFSLVIDAMTKPDIVDVISQRVGLRRAGQEHFGRCPLHDDTHPSFYVNEVKQVYFCHGCQVGGDVVDFIMRIDDLSFPDACKALGVDLRSKPRPKLTAKRKHAAEVAAIWVREQRANLNSLIIEDMEERDLADEIGDDELSKSLNANSSCFAVFMMPSIMQPALLNCWRSANPSSRSLPMWNFY